MNEREKWETELEDKAVNLCKELCKTMSKLKQLKKGEFYGIPGKIYCYKSIHEGVIIKTDTDLDLKLKESSWVNFFRVMYNRKTPIELVDGSSLEGFHISIMELENQFKEKSGFEESFYNLMDKKINPKENRRDWKNEIL